MITRGILLALMFCVAGCASYFKRKECESANWFEHGQKVAKSGKNLEGDPFISQCREAKAEFSWQQLDLGYKTGRQTYCSSQGAFDTGRGGHPFNRSLCDGGGLANLEAQYRKGILEYCHVDNGEPDGASGRIYENVCPKNLEAAFLQGYRRGRFAYLNGKILSLRSEIEERESEVERLDRRAQDSARQADLLERRAEKRSISTSVSGSFYASGSTSTPQEELSERAQEQRNQAYRMESEASQIRAQVGQLRQELRTFEAEVETLRHLHEKLERHK